MVWLIAKNGSYGSYGRTWWTEKMAIVKLRRSWWRGRRKGDIWCIHESEDEWYFRNILTLSH
jgi:hypothetical protein